MKRFIFKSLLFIVILCIIDLCAANVFLLRDKVKSGKARKISHILNEEESDIIILGSSRALHHYNPKIFEDSLGLSTYNAGFSGNGIILMQGLFDKITERTKPKIMLYELTPSFDYDKNDNVKYLFSLKPYFNDSKINSLFKTVDLLEYLKMHSSLYRLNSYYLRLMFGLFRNEEDRFKGFLPLTDTMNYEPKIPAPKVHEVDSFKLQFLRDLILKSKKENIQLIFTISPVYSHPDTIFNILKNYILKEGCIVLDHHSDNGFTGQKIFFSDPTHLNNTGADTLSSIIANELRIYIK